MSEILRTEHIVQRFGGMEALKDISMRVESGEIVGVIGPNGAGKTTLFNCITGMYCPTEGRVHMLGTDITGWRPYRITAHGFARTFQNIRLFQKMSVLDNVMVGMHVKTRLPFPQNLIPGRADKVRKEAEARAEELLKILGLYEVRYEMATSLPYGDQRKVEICRALAIEPKLLLLDEPAAGMNEVETEELRTIVHKLREMGNTILLIEHDMRFVMNIFKEQWESMGGTVSVYESFVPGETKDFSAVLSKVKEAAPDILYVNASYNDCAQAFMQAKQLELDAQYVGPGMCVNEEFLGLVGDQIDGTYILSSTPCFLPSVLEAGNVNEATQAFIDAYKEAYGETPDGFSAQGYDSVNIVLNSILAAGTTDAAAVATQIGQIRDYPGLSGFDMSYNDQKEMDKGIYVFQLQNGTFVRMN